MADEAIVKCTEGGPNLVFGVRKVVKADGTVVDVEDGKPAALCACGRSASKPFCDGSHAKSAP